MNLENEIEKYKEIKSELWKMNFNFSDKEIAKISRVLELYGKVLKKKYAYWLDKEIPTVSPYYYKGKLTSIYYNSHVWTVGINSLYLFGVQISSIGYSFQDTKKYNAVKDIPMNFVLQQNKTDEYLNELQSLVIEVNDFILKHTESFISGNEVSKQFRKKNIEHDIINRRIRNHYNAILKSDIGIKLNDKYSNKIKDIFVQYPNSLYIKHCDYDYTHGYILPIYMKCDEFCDFSDNCTFKTKKKLGSLNFKDGKVTFEPNINNEKYFKNKISSLRFLKNTFKNGLVKLLEINK